MSRKPSTKTSTHAKHAFVQLPGDLGAILDEKAAGMKPRTSRQSLVEYLLRKALAAEGEIVR